MDMKMTMTMTRTMTRTLFNDLELDSTSGAWPQLHRGCLQTISFFPWPVCDASVKSAVISTKIQRESPVAESGHSRLGQSLKRGARPFPPVLTWGEDFDWWQWCWCWWYLWRWCFTCIVFWLSTNSWPSGQTLSSLGEHLQGRWNHCHLFPIILKDLVELYGGRAEHQTQVGLDMQRLHEEREEQEGKPCSSQNEDDDDEDMKTMKPQNAWIIE